MVSPQAKRQAVDVLMEERGLGVTRACGLVGISRSLYRYRRRPEPAALVERLRELAAVKRRYGYRRLHVLLRREGFAVNRKRVQRLYREAGLTVRRRKRKRIGPVERHPLPKPVAANVSWSMAQAALPDPVHVPEPAGGRAVAALRRTQEPREFLRLLLIHQEQQLPLTHIHLPRVCQN
jgi:transposase InsO family protein